MLPHYLTRPSSHIYYLSIFKQVEIYIQDHVVLYMCKMLHKKHILIIYRFPYNQAFEIEQLKETVNKLTESNKQLEAENKILADESSYVKELAAEAAVELQALTEEVIKLMNHNEKLSAELAGEKHSPAGRKTMGPTKRKKDQSPTQLELKRELALSKERELAYEDILSEKYKKESELQEIVNESKQREAYLENEVADMWILLAKLKSSQDSGFEI